jgi:peptide-methionine (S)-S-oxide reductase
VKWVLLAGLVSCSGTQAASPTQAASAVEAGQSVAIFAGGCFWCMEGAFEAISGVVSVESGYTGGPELGPSYRAVSMGQTGHFEAIRVVYEPQRVAYSTLLGVFWKNIDPTQADGQFCDRGDQYRSAVFVAGPTEHQAATASKEESSKTLGRPVVTPILPAQTFWLAEDYHQDFYKKNPERYQRYRAGCGRDRRLKQLWGEAAGGH